MLVFELISLVLRLSNFSGVGSESFIKTNQSEHQTNQHSKPAFSLGQNSKAFFSASAPERDQPTKALSFYFLDLPVDQSVFQLISLIFRFPLTLDKMRYVSKVCSIYEERECLYFYCY